MNKENQISIQDFNQQISIYELIIISGISLKKQGKNFIGLCPFHKEKTPSFSVSPEKNIALCMACHKGGGPVKFYSQLKNISYSKAIEELSKKFNLKIFYPKKQNFNNYFYNILKETHEYYQKALQSCFRHDKHPLKIYLLKERNLNQELIQEFQLGYAYDDFFALQNYLLNKGFKIKDLLNLGLVSQPNIDKKEYFDFFRNRIIFPLTDSENRIIGFSGRCLPLNDNEKSKFQIKQPKYLINKDTNLFKKNNCLYRFFEHHSNIKQSQEVILCEGFFDVISFFKVGIKNAVATLGTQLSLNQINLLKKVTDNALIAYDGDQAGKAAMENISLILIKENFKVKIIFFPNETDPDQFINEENNNNFNSQLLNNLSQDYVLRRVGKYLEEYKKENSNIEIEEIKKKIKSLLKNQDKIKKDHYQKQIYMYFQLHIDLKENDPTEEEENLFFIKSLQNQKKFNVQKYHHNDDYFYNLFYPYQKKISQKCEIVKKKNINMIIINLLTDIFLHKNYVSFIKEEISKFYIHSEIIELIFIIKGYYERYHNNTKFNEKGININHFILVSKNFLNKFPKQIDFYDLFSDIKTNCLFIKEKKIKHREDLNIFYLQFEINKKKEEEKEIHKELNKLGEQSKQTEEQLQIKKLFQEIFKKQQKIKNIQETIKQLNQKINLLLQKE
ncbi:DNA primase [Candidatus Phytoplasma pini]|uniref:DNA primase n=1 Tax=Candidatus Phytoplasma pini TaxID=267362 RepID=A0A559KJ68_9MOLU|nr:DNA primase [Candidatus Phytoplasma pini]TVY12174.1 DNA primase [Candidatus Phytoplasma pini]